MSGSPSVVFLRNGSARTGSLVIAGLLVLAVLGPLLCRHGPYESDFVHGISPQFGPAAPSARFLLGTDRLFRDELARLSLGARLSLVVASGATFVALVIGSAVGMVSGWFEGKSVRVPWAALAGGLGALAGFGLGRLWVGVMAFLAGCAGSVFAKRAGATAPVDLDGVLMRLVDVLLAFPFLLLLMTIGAALERTTVMTLFLTLGVTGWPGIARLLRARTMQIRELEYVVASRALGQTTLGIFGKHVLPNVVGPLIVAASFLVAQMIVADGILSYLGVGLSPPAPTWGRMLLEGQDEYLAAPWLVLAPGIAILLAVWGFNLIGEGLRDSLDPRGT